MYKYQYNLLNTNIEQFVFKSGQPVNVVGRSFVARLGTGDGITIGSFWREDRGDTRAKETLSARFQKYFSIKGVIKQVFLNNQKKSNFSIVMRSV